MDRAEISKRVERAEKLLQKGKPAEALDEYLHVLTFEPANDAVCQMASDLCLSLQRIPEAVKLLGDMFERQIQAGDATRASLTYKKLARFVTPTWEQTLRFGEILENTNRKLALETYESVFQEMTKQARKPDALLALQHCLHIDSGEKNLLRLAELSSELNDSKAAAGAFTKLAELYRSSNRDAAPWIERAYAEDPTDNQIALAYSKGLLEQGQIGAAIFVLEPMVAAGGASDETRDAFAKALLSANRLSEAEPILWQLFEENPSRIQEIPRLIGLFMDSEQDTDAVVLSRKLEQYQRRKGDRRGFLATMQELMSSHRPSAEMLEFMSEQFNAANRESDYCQTLLKLFDLHCSTGNFDKAAEALDRAVEVDAYEHGHAKRLDMLKGKIDENRFKVISSRLSSMADAIATPVHTDEKLLGAAALQDLMLQAEILVQYGMRTKALERLQRIQQLFPREEERNQNLAQLYMTAGLVPSYPDAAPRPAPSPSVPPPPPPPPPVASPVAPVATSAPPPPPAADMSSFTRVAEITRKLYRQNNADAVMSTAVNEIGSHWKASRCVVAMRKPGLRPTSTKEFCGPASVPADAGQLEKLISAVHDVALQRGGALTIVNAQAAPEVEHLRDLLGQMGVVSLLVVPLADGTEQSGVLVLTHTTPGVWNSNDVLVLKTICDQIVIALNNAGLRRLVKNLSVTDERSGLLKRASYLDLLMAEVRRNIQQSTLVSVLLVQFGEKNALLKEFGESAVEAVMQQVGQLISANIRQYDLAFRYQTTTIAIVLGETAEKEGLLAAEKLQRLVSEVKFPDKQDPVRFNAGLAEAVMRAEYDPADIVTEVANRAEHALKSAVAQGPSKIVSLAPSVAAAAVA